MTGASTPHKKLIAALTICALAIATWILFKLNGRVDEDGVLYLEVAKRIAARDYQSALALYNWPFFSWLIASVHQFTGLGLLTAARFLEALFFGIAAYALLTLTERAGGGKTAIISVALLLFSSNEIVGHALTWIMRDQGFWAFYLLGLVFFERYARLTLWKDALLWQVCCFLAMLFRIEALTFFIVLPLCLLSGSNPGTRNRLPVLAKAYSLTPVAVLAMIFLAMHFDLNIGRFSEAYTRLHDSYVGITSGLASRAEVFGRDVLNPYIDRYALGGLLLTLGLAVVGKILSASGLLPAALSVLWLRKRHIVPEPLATIFSWAAAVNLLNIVVAILSAYILMDRHAIGLAFILFILAGLMLERLVNQLRSNPRTSGMPFTRYSVAVLLSLIVIGHGLYANLIKNLEPENYRKDAVVWLKQHAPNETNIFYSDARLRYYAQVPWQGRDKNWPASIDSINAQPIPYKYLVLTIRGEDPMQQKLLQRLDRYKAIKTFKNKGNNYAVVLERQE